MSHFANHEIAFDVPDDWTDRSTTTFVLPEAATSITLSSGAAEPGIPLEAYADHLVRQLDAVCPELEIIEVRRDPTGPLQLTVQWQHPATRFRNVIRCVLVDGMLWSLTASTPIGALDSTGLTIARTLDSFQCQVPMPTPKFW